MDVKEKKVVLFSRKKRAKKPKSLKKRLAVFGIVILLLAGVYCTAVFSNIPFIKKWRDLYIETAMDTYTHKWLATMFIPKSVIDGVMNAKEGFIEGQQDLQSSWTPAPSTQDPSEAPSEEDQAKADFLSLFYELDKSSFDGYIAKNPDMLADGYGKLLINKSGVNDSGTAIYTTNGDQVVVLDAENGILIVKVTGEGYVGKLAIVKNPAQVRLGISKHLGNVGQTVGQIAKDNHAVLAINASGFADPEWKGNGGQVVGLLIANGKTLNGPVKNGYLNIGFSEDDRLYIGVSTSKLKYRDAVEFIPALIINGKNVTDGSTGFGIQPRSAIGQAEDGTVFLLTIDGRQVGYSLGTTVGVCADILLKYGAVQASNLDGGSSTIMIYRDKVITKPSSTTNIGRLVPDAFIVDYAKAAEK
ncbi:Exopolysaccharide biosynthesis protein [Sporobacter termitidis DSM 10068]|uniref:Exopolysaccharide biosynthesis protein n=1 Tax=Sporobacter termitidis DSM 10068 TaxID=1123282 RepID=A0A1M5WCX8_9FIRM|nr:phosphodiester glycosidase family protein [Sporobacter termitidis]SHH85352.1 Exopolysaccharide biosynthesis protein [Sporobacter termitidis DSM 10068]